MITSHIKANLTKIYILLFEHCLLFAVACRRNYSPHFSLYGRRSKTSNARKTSDIHVTINFVVQLSDFTRKHFRTATENITKNSSILSTNTINGMKDAYMNGLF